MLSLLLLACSSPTPPAAVASPAARPGLTLGEVASTEGTSGLTLESRPYTFNDTHGTVWVVRVARDAELRVMPSEAVQHLDRLLALPETGSWAAVNGGFYERGPMGLVVSEGQELAPLSGRGGSGVLSWSPELGPQVQHRDSWTPGPTEALQSIDRLVDQGASLVNRRPKAQGAARSAVSLGESEIQLIVAADADSIRPREGGAQLVNTVGRGLPLWAFAELLVQLGAQQALNMDGAISTGLLVSVDGKVTHLRSERGTINAVLLRPRPTEAPGPPETPR